MMVSENRTLHLRGIAHTLHTTSDHHRLVSRRDALSGKHNGLQSAGADLVNSCRIGAGLHASSKSDLTCRGLANTRLYDIAEVDLLHGCGVDLGLFEGMLEGDNTELGSGQSLESSVNGSDRCSGRSDNDYFVRLRLEVRVSRCGQEGGRFRTIVWWNAAENGRRGMEEDKSLPAASIGTPRLYTRGLNVDRQDY